MAKNTIVLGEGRVITDTVIQGDDTVLVTVYRMPKGTDAGAYKRNARHVVAAFKFLPTANRILSNDLSAALDKVHAIAAAKQTLSETRKARS